MQPVGDAADNHCSSVAIVVSKKKDKNIQQRVFASGHPPNY
jgi:hypothetical protein